jgi:putative endonuclease
MAWVYLLTCADGSFYVGSTWDLDRRMEQHAAGKGCKYTRRRLPVTLSWAMEFEGIQEAWVLERRLHGWSRAKKQALIDGRFADLGPLSRNHTQFGPPEPPVPAN